MRTACRTRLSPVSRRVDEGEGFKLAHRAPILTLPLSLQKGEANQHALRRSPQG